MADRQAPTYQQVVARDPSAAPRDYYEHHPFEGGPDRVDAARYYSADFHRLEMERLWSRTWQLACREEEIPEAGDVLEYAIGDRSYLIVRGEDGRLRAFPNACRHRGTRLCAGGGSMQWLRCRYHGFTWSLDGQLADFPAREDFPHVSAETHSLPGLRLDVWQGFVFINPDPDAAPLADHLEILPRHFTGFSDYSRKYIGGYYRKTLPSNWKAALEAFLEALHLVETHPQMCSFASDVATQYDVYPGARHVSRFVGANGVASPNLPDMFDEQAVLDAAFGLMTEGRQDAPRLGPDETARSVMAGLARHRQAELASGDYAGCSDAEAIDGAQYLVFPNMVLFRGFGFPVVYRFRPNGGDPESSIFDMMIMRDVPDGAPRPAPAEAVDMGAGSYRDMAAELPRWLGEVYDQDTDNLAEQQLGFRNLPDGMVTLSRYQESRLRHFHMVLDEYLASAAGGFR